MQSQAENYSLPEGFDDPSTGGNNYENLSLKPDTDVVYRILPAMKSLRARRDFTQFWYTHFWKGRNPKDPTKTKSVPILCIQEKDFRNGGMITKQCPLCEKREEVKNQIKIVEAKILEKKGTKAQVQKAVQPYNIWLKDHGHDGKYRIYVLDEGGKLGVLRLNSTCVKKLREEIRRATKEGYEPLSGRAGLWCQFSRRGTGFDVDDTVRFLTDRPAHMLDASLAKTALEVLPDFDEEQARIRYSEEQLQALASMETDDPDEVNRILGIRDVSDLEVDQEPVDHPKDDVELHPTGVSDEDAETAALEAEKAALEARLAASRAAKLAAAKTGFTPPQKPAQPKPATFSVEAASEEDLDAAFDDN
jgi:hypothetical protein